MIPVIVLLLFSFLLTIVVGHELTHWLTARAFGFQTPVFGIGLPLGPYKVIGRARETEFRVHLIPLGAYVSIPELDPPPQDPGTETELPKPYKKFSFWKKLIVVIAGSAFYVATAWVIIFITLVVQGEPNVAVMVRDFSTTNHIARDAGVQIGDKIVSVDSLPVKDSNDVVSYLKTRSETEVSIGVLRNDENVTLKMTTAPGGKLGMMLQAQVLPGFRRLGMAEAVCTCFTKLQAIGSAFLPAAAVTIGQKFQTSSGEPSQIVAVSVPTTVFVVVNATLEDFRNFWMLLSLLAMDFAIINAWPLPGLDGGHAFAILFSTIRGKPLPNNIVTKILAAILSFILLFNCVPLCLMRGRKKR